MGQAVPMHIRGAAMLHKVTQINGNGYTKLHKGAVVICKITQIIRHLQRVDVIWNFRVTEKIEELIN